MTDILEGGFTPPEPEVIREHAEPRPEPPRGKIRPFWQGFALAVVTLSLYHFWWHWNTHREVTLRRREHDAYAWLWFAYIATLVASLVLALSYLSELAQADVSSADGALAQWRAMAMAGINPLPHQILWLGSGALFLAFVARQFLFIRRFRREVGLPTRTMMPVAMGVLPFLITDLLRLLGGWFIAVLSVLIAMAGYALLQVEYNELWREVAEMQPRLLHAETRVAGATSVGRPIMEMTFACPDCHGPIHVVGIAGERVAADCGSCGHRGDAVIERSGPAEPREGTETESAAPSA